MTESAISSRASRTPRWLIDAAQRGDPAAERELLRRYEPLVQRVVWKLRLPPGCEREDLAQEARVGLVAAIRAWQPERGPFPAFADRCVSNQALLALEAACRRKHQLLSRAVSLDSPRPGAGARGRAPGTQPARHARRRPGRAHRPRVPAARARAADRPCSRDRDADTARADRDRRHARRAERLPPGAGARSAPPRRPRTSPAAPGASSPPRCHAPPDRAAVSVAEALRHYPRCSPISEQQRHPGRFGAAGVVRCDHLSE